ncbi:MAG: hypothetical protein VX427_05385 [Acidobacteriota bacterium]|nr:hypothetical protein [Acidobacteriota bacterium]
MGDQMRRWAIVTTACAALLALVDVSVGTHGQNVRDVPIPHDVGQSVSPSFEGWFENRDGTFTLSWGYFNRNYEERPDIPVGPNNRFDPGPADRGQPTYFLPRRQTGVFTTVVPADFGDQTLTWTVVRGGETIAIPGHLRPEWVIDAMMEAPSKNTPPVVRFEPAGEIGRGPGGVRGAVAATFPDTTITVWARDDMVRKMREQQRAPDEDTEATAPRFGVAWSKYRGSGTVTFSETEPQIDETGKAVTTATFSEPGEYVLRVLAWDDTGPQAFVMAVGFQCCWTNGYLTVDVQ